MKNLKLSIATAIVGLLLFANCTHDDYEPTTAINTGVDESADELLVKKFSTAPTFDGEIDAVWSEARPLINRATVPYAGDRIITLNKSSNFDTDLEPTDLMEPYSGESYKFSLRGGHDDEYLYLLFEWEDDTDSQDRESWFFNPATNKWQQENKYANHKNDKFYEDKFGFMFPVGNPEGFANNTCFATCHGSLELTGVDADDAGNKVTRHYMKNEGEITDFWHWKRDRHALAEACDDGYVQWEEDEGFATANGRKNDPESISPYANNQTFEDAVTGMKGPKYVIPNIENYYWIAQSEIDNETAKEVTGIALDGTITLEDGTTINPNEELYAYSQGFGSKRMPSIIINPAGQGNDGRSEVRVKAIHNGSGWQLEIRRLLDTGDTDYDINFKAFKESGESIPFGLAIFNNAAIGHGMTNNLSMKIE